MGTPKITEHLQKANSELEDLNSYTDYVLLQHFTTYSLFQVMNFADSA